MKYPPVLVLDLSATGLAVARILSKHGVHVYGADIHSLSIGKFSKYVKKPSFGYKVHLGLEFLDQMIEFAKNFDTKPVLFPSSDVFIEFVSEHYSEIKKYFSLQESLSSETSKKFLNKKEFYKLCEENGVKYPKTMTLKGTENLDEIIGKMRFPLILKPHFIHKWKDYLKGRKVIYIKNEIDLDHVLNIEKDLLKDSVLQEVILGPETNIYIFKGYFDKNSNLKSYFVGKKIRQYPPYFGSFSIAESIENEEIKNLSVEFLEKVKFKGLCGTEFKYDQRDNDYKIIEINIRPQLWEDLTRLARREVLWSAYCDLAGFEVPSESEQRKGVKLVYLIRDIYSSIILLKNRDHNILEWIKSYKNVKGGALFDLKDWKLIFGIPLYFLSQLYEFKIKPLFKRKK